MELEWIVAGGQKLKSMINIAKPMILRLWRFLAIRPQDKETSPEMEDVVLQ